MQSNNIREYHVFLASPGDVREEREEARKFFESFNRTIATRLRIRFTVVDWENYSNIGVGRPQELITSQTLERFKESLALVVGIMGQRFGSPTGTHESGTEEEFEWAFNSNREIGFPEIKWFFKDIKTFQAPSDLSEIKYALEQWEKVQLFKDKFRTSEPPVYYGSYTDTADFRETLRNDLQLWLNDETRPWFEGREQEAERKSELNITDLSSGYYQSLEQIYKSLDIRGIDNDKAVDIPLSDVYVRLRVIRDENVETDEQEQDLGELDIHDALNRFKRLVIVGDPGSGKSTFLKFIALILAQSKIANDPSIATTKLSLTEPLPIPFFVSLWDLSDHLKKSRVSENNAILDFIINRLADFNVKLSSEELEKILRSGNCCLLFDGLDEVPTEQGRALISRLLERFVSQFPENRYVVTSRVRGYSGDTILKNEFIRCDIQDFDENDRAEFLKNWFAALFRVDKEEILKEGTKSNKEFTELHNSVETKDRIRALAVNPLLMTVIAIVHWNRKRLPDQRVDLYDECVDVLLGQRKIAERVGQSKAIEILDESKEEGTQYDRTWTRKRFAEIALLILQSGEDEETTRESVVKLLTPRFIDRGAENKEKAEYQAEKFLDDQELKSGLLVSRRSKSCRFVHLTFQEYLAAWNLANQSLDNVKLTIQAQLRNPQWFETLQLLGGELAKNSDEKLDDYISYLLDNIGIKIAEQAPIIALCANILSDVKGVADIKADTRSRYTSALRGTLDAFKPNSRVPANTQLEVLHALAQLGASVKEHLIQATKSSYFQVRSAALSMLVVHLSDDDLFGMRHILNDRSREPIAVYLIALFERDKRRAKEILKQKISFDEKDIKALSLIFKNYLEGFEALEIATIIQKIEDFYFSPYADEIERSLSLRQHDQEEIIQIFFDLIKDNKMGDWGLSFLLGTFGESDKFWKWVIANIIYNRDEKQLIAILDAINYSYLFSSYFVKYSKDFTAVWDFITETSLHSPSFELRKHAIRILSLRFNEFKGVLFDLAFNSEDKKIRQLVLMLLISKFNSYLISELLGDIRAIRYSNLTILSSTLLEYPYYYYDSMQIEIEKIQDPQEPINQQWIQKCASRFNVSESKMREHFEKLTEVLPIKIEN